MKLEKKVFVAVGEKVRIVEPDPEFYAQREHLLGKEYTIKTLYTTDERFMEKDEVGDLVCKRCPIETIDTFFVVEEPDYEFISDNISIPKEIERELKSNETPEEKVKSLLAVLKEITECESARDAYDLAVGALKKYK